jgi:hypothetical protein
MSKKAVVAFGRLNPPTVGHEKLAKKIESVARKEKAQAFLYLSHSQDKKKNPIDYNTKIRIAKKAFGNMVTKSSSRNIIEILKEIQNKGFDSVIVVAGQDRVSEFEKLINKYNGREYTFEEVKIESAGARDPDAEGVEGMSASKLRDLAKKGEMETFKKGMPSKLTDSDKETVYNAIRQFGEDYDEDDDFLTDDDIEDMILNMDEEDWDDIFNDELDELEEETELEEAPLSVAQRFKRGRIAKRYASRTSRKRNIKLRRRAGREQLKSRARRGAIRLIKKRVAGKKGENYAQLSPSQKVSVDKAAAKRMNQVDRIAKRMLPDVRRKETQRMKNRSNRNESFEITESVTQQQINDLEKFGDRLLKKFDIDIEFSRHFADRMNDARNNPDISVAEIQALFKKIAKNKAKNIINNKGSEVVLKDIQKDLNLPIVIKVDGNEIDVIHKTIMRKKNFTTPNKVIEYEETEADKRFNLFLEKTENDEKNTKALHEKAKVYGISFEILETVYNRGIESFSKVSRNDLSESQWAWTRVNSFLAGGRARERDADLIEEKVCWDGYKQVGMKKKNGKEVPNCVPEEGGAGEEGTDKLRKRYTKDTPGQTVEEQDNVDRAKEIIDREKTRDSKKFDRKMDLARLRDVRSKNRQTRPTNEEACCEECANELNETVYEVLESEYQGKNVTLNKPFRANDGKHDECVYVKNDKGNVVKVCYGDASMKNRDDNPKARKSFRARHGCDNPGPKWRAKYWACKNW